MSMCRGRDDVCTLCHILVTELCYLNIAEVCGVAADTIYTNIHYFFTSTVLVSMFTITADIHFFLTCAVLVSMYSITAAGLRAGPRPPVRHVSPPWGRRRGGAQSVSVHMCTGKAIICENQFKQAQLKHTRSDDPVGICRGGVCQIYILCVLGVLLKVANLGPTWCCGPPP